MTFSVLTEMQVNGAWTNISGDVLLRDEIEITRGKQSEDGQAAPQTARLTLNNRAGKYSPRNPLGPNYGQFGRNTQIRIAVEVDPVFDAHSSTQGTGNLSWTHTPVGSPTGVVVFVWQYNTNVSQINSVTYGGVPMERKTYALCAMGGFNAIAYMYFLNRTIPTGPQTVVVDTSAVIMRQASALTVIGGTNAEIDSRTFAYSNATPSANPATSMTMFKRAVIFGSMLSDLDDVTTLAPGVDYTGLGNFDLGTEVVAVERAGVQIPGAYNLNWTAASGHWAIMGAAIRTVYYRFWGEVSAWPAKWDTSGNDAWVEIEAAGLTRRLGQGVDPSESGLKAFIFPQTGLFRYWPLGGAKGTQYSLDISPVWGSPQNFRYFSEGASFAYGQDLENPFLGTAMALFNTTSGSMRGNVATGYANWAFDFVYQAPEFGNFFVTFYDYSGNRWSVQLNGGVAQVQLFDNSTSTFINFTPTGVLPSLRDTLPHHVRFKVLKSGADTVWTLYLDGVSIATGTQLAHTVEGMSIFRMDYTRTGTQTWVNLMHLAVWADIASETWPSAALASQAAQGYVGEAAGTRIGRIAALSNYALTTVGTLADTALMGPQYSESLLTQLRDAESTDLGILAEPRDAFGLQYRTLRSHYNQAAKFTLDATSRQVAPPFELLDDDQLTRNDITAVRRDGDSVRTTQATGPLSIQAPPAGVGRYKNEVTVNVQDDDMLWPVGGWLLNIGTVNEARLPALRVNLANSNVTPLVPAILATDLGDRVFVNGLSALTSIYGGLSLIVLGSTERISTFGWDLVFNCTPASPYEVIALDDVTSRISSGEASTLTSSLTTTATSMSVTSTAGTLWTTLPADMPISLLIAGEEMTVTAISGAASPQTFTVTRSVNGVVKTQAAGAIVRLKRRAVWAL